MFEMKNKNSWLGDARGGVTATMAALPVELVYGLFAVAPLGSAFNNHGLRAAMWACIVGGMLGFLMRTTGGLITGSRPATALILGSLAATLLPLPEIQSATDPEGMVFVLLLVCTALAGLFQLGFGLLKLGRVLKYVPYPVIAGLMCGVGVLMLLSALRPALGAHYDTTWQEVTESWHPLSLLVTLTTILVCFRAARWTRRVPAIVLALLAGSLLHHLLAFALGPDHLGETAREIHGLLPDFSVWQAILSQGTGGFLPWLPTLVPFALAIAAFSSLETLLCLSTIESIKHERPDGDRELCNQGFINFLAGLLGATYSSGNLSRVVINLSSGGRGVASALFYALALVLVIVFFGSWVSWVPSAVTAGILTFSALAMFDDGTRRLFIQLLTQREELAPAEYRLLLSNFGVIILVALFAVLGGMMNALVIGIAAAMFLFIRSSMKPVIRRVFNAQYCRSLRVRSHEDMRFLEQQCSQILVIEIEGALFFGTAERVSREIECVAKQATAIVLDLRRVSDVDPTGARTLLLAAQKMHAQQKKLLLSGVNQRVERFLRALGLNLAVESKHWHHDLDAALEVLEDEMLAVSGRAEEQNFVHLSQTDLAKGLTASQVATLERYLTIHLFSVSGPVFKCGEGGESLFFANSSIVDILLPLQTGRRKRVASFAPGVVFGEMALLERKPRSADALLLGAGVVWELSRQNLQQIEVEHPKIAYQILFNLSCCLAERLRLTTTELRQVVEL